MSENRSAFHNNPALWMIVIVPVVAVVVGVCFLIISVKTFDGLVVDDYYKKGKQINQVLARDGYASDHYLFADVILDKVKKRVEVELSAGDNFNYPDQINLQFLHRTKSGRDKMVNLESRKPGKYSGLLPDLSESRWLVELGTPMWRLTGELVWPVQTNFELEAMNYSQ